MIDTAKNSKGTKPKFRIILAHALGTPGYILWLVGWLLLLALALSFVGTRSQIVPVSNDSSELNILVTPQPFTVVQGALTIATASLIWYTIAAVIRKGVWSICKRRANPEMSWLILMVGGVVITWLGMGGLLLATGAVWSAVAAILGLPLFVGVVSLLSEILLEHYWDIEG